MARPSTSKMKQYRALWKLIKKEGEVSVKLAVSALETPEKLRDTIIKAIGKQKYNDTEFKNSYPYTKLESTFQISEDRLKLVLTFKLLDYWREIPQ